MNLYGNRVYPLKPKTLTMEFVYFTTAGIVLYFGADWILNRIEEARGKRFPNRTLVFFVIILIMAVTTFNIIQHLTDKT